MSVDKYLSIFSNQMEAIAELTFLNFGGFQNSRLVNSRQRQRSDLRPYAPDSYRQIAPFEDTLFAAPLLLAGSLAGIYLYSTHQLFEGWITLSTG